MARKLILALALGGLLLHWSAQGRADAAAAATAISGDADILGLVSSVHEHEIAAADMARSKHVTGETLAYAETLHQDHSAALQKTQALAKDLGIMPSNDGVVAKKRAEFKHHESQLQGVTQPAFANQYLEAMVKGHEQVLSMIDEKLLPAAQGPAVKEFLNTTRESVNKHLAIGRGLIAK